MGSTRSTIPGSAAEGGVVSTFARIQFVEQMVVTDGYDAALDGPADDREAHEGREELGKERDDVDREHEENRVSG